MSQNINKAVISIIQNGASQTQVSSSKLFIGGIPHNTSSDELRAYFGRFGRVNLVNLPVHKKSGKLRGFAFVEFSDSESAVSALSVKEHVIRGKKMALRPAMNSKEASKLTKNLQARKIYAKGFPLDTSEGEIMRFFKGFGEVDRVLMGNSCKQSGFKGFAYIIMCSDRSYQRVFEEALKHGNRLMFRGSHVVKVYSSKTREQLEKKSKGKNSSGLDLLNRLSNDSVCQSSKADEELNFGENALIRQLRLEIGSEESTFSKNSSSHSANERSLMSLQSRGQLSQKRAHAHKLGKTSSFDQLHQRNEATSNSVRGSEPNHLSSRRRRTLQYENCRNEVNRDYDGDNLNRYFSGEDSRVFLAGNQHSRQEYLGSREDIGVTPCSRADRASRFENEDDDLLGNSENFSQRDHRNLTGSELIERHNLIFRAHPRSRRRRRRTMTFSDSQYAPNQEVNPNMISQYHQNMNYAAQFTGGRYSNEGQNLDNRSQQQNLLARNQHYGPENGFGDNTSDPTFMRRRYARDVESQGMRPGQDQRVYYGPNFLPGNRNRARNSSENEASDDQEEGPSIEIKQTITTKYVIKNQGIVYNGTINETNIWGSHPHQDY